MAARSWPCWLPTKLSNSFANSFLVVHFGIALSSVCSSAHIHFVLALVWYLFCKSLKGPGLLLNKFNLTLYMEYIWINTLSLLFHMFWSFSPSIHYGSWIMILVCAINMLYLIWNAYGIPDWLRVVMFNTDIVSCCLCSDDGIGPAGILSSPFWL